ncbi:hypothetical protein [Candidatus Rhabdochlamydia sp. T3358]|uniref:hypothetical protein n=1 Tax=Candidatus Rhabdochlamydia sp. T3358 TaxID=2099795 RepID=UPI0010B93990|nr:hypothetical protein [Candidatus Rhabdochlamydia sp. T3358]VHO04302.1 hypothetical protein RHT_01301 [Candidatus Rhabdochlamydia sp. T3358]
MTITTVTSSNFHSSSCSPQTPDCRTKMVSVTYRCSKCSERCLNCLKNQGTLPYYVQGCDAARRVARGSLSCRCTGSQGRCIE